MSLETEVDEVSEALIDGVWSDDPSLQLESATKIRSILSQKDITCPSEIVIRSRVVPRLVQFLDKEDFPKLQYEAAWVLTNIATEKPDVVVDHRAVPVLVQLLASPRYYVREQAIWALSNVSGDSIHNRDFVCKCGVLMPLLRLLYKDTTLRIATWTLCTLCCGKPPPAFDQSVIDANLIPSLVYLAQNTDFDMKKEALWAISNVTLSGSHDQIKYMVEQNCIKPLRTILQCLNGLVNILKAGEAEKNTGYRNCYAQLIEGAEGLEKIENLQRHDNNVISEKAFLETYWLAGR